MAKIVDVTDVPDMPGAGMLHFDDGRPPMMALPDIANEWRERVGAQPDRRLADNGKSLVPGAVGVEDDGAMGRALGNAWDATKNFLTTPAAHAQNAGYRPPPAASPPPQAAPAVAPSPQAAPSGPPPMIARPPEPSAPAAPGSEQQAPPGTDQGAPPQSLADQAMQHVRDQAADELLHGKVVQGGPARAAGYVPSSRSIKTEGAVPYDTGMAGQRIDADRSLLDAQLYQAKTQQDIAQADAARAQTANIVATRQAAGAQASLQQKQYDFQQQQQYMQQELQDYSQSAQPDPDRFFKQRSTVSNVLSALGQALGAAGASLGHTQNFAFEYVQNQIRNDIAAQEMAYNSGRADRRDALARFVNYYNGDMDLAKQGLSIAMNKVASTEAQQFAAQSQSQQIGANAQVLAAQFERDSLKREQDMYNASIGKVTTEESDKYQQASGGGPGRKPLTDAEIAARDKLLKPGKDQGALGLSAQGVARQKAAYSTKTEALASFADSLSHRATLMGIHFDPKTGELTGKNGKPVHDGDLDVPVGAGYFGKHISGDVLTPKAMELRRAEENSVRLHAAAVYNHSISAEEGAQEVDKTIGSTDAAKLANMRYLAEEYRKRKLAIDTGAASIDPRLVNERDEAERAVNYARATGQPLPGPSRRAGIRGDSSSDDAAADAAEASGEE